MTPYPNDRGIDQGGRSTWALVPGSNAISRFYPMTTQYKMWEQNWEHSLRAGTQVELKTLQYKLQSSSEVLCCQSGGGEGA